jgi:hypothetical protein
MVVGATALLTSLTLVQAQRPEPKPKDAPRDGDRDLEGRMAAKRHLEELRGNLKELESAGKMEKAGEVAREIKHLREKLEVPGKDKEFAKKPTPQRPPEPRRMEAPQRGGGPGAPPAKAEAQEQRLHHLRVAIENLRAAGLMEPAERLQEQVEQWQRRPEMGKKPGQPQPPIAGGQGGFGPQRPFGRFGGGHGFGGGRGGLGPQSPFGGGGPGGFGPSAGPPMRFRAELSELQGQIQQLRQELQELHQRLDKK